MQNETNYNNTHEINKSKKTPGPKKRKTILESERTTEVKQLVFGEYYNVQTMQVHFETTTFIEQEAKKLKAWADLDTSLRLNDFIDQQGYTPDVFRGWCTKYPLLELIRAYALRRIGSRRENGAMLRKFAESTVHRTLGHYDEIWREQTLLHQKMKDEKNNGPANIIVMMTCFDRMANTDAVNKTSEQAACVAHALTNQATANSLNNHC